MKTATYKLTFSESAVCFAGIYRKAQIFSEPVLAEDKFLFKFDKKSTNLLLTLNKYLPGR